MSVLEKKKVVSKRGMTAVSIMHFFFRYCLPKQSLVSQFLVSERKKTLKAMKMMTSQTAISPLLILPH